MKLRLARNKDSEQIIKLIRKCFKDYQNCFLDVDNDSPELKYVYSYFHGQTGKFWVFEDKKKLLDVWDTFRVKKMKLKFINYT